MPVSPPEEKNDVSEDDFKLEDGVPLMPNEAEGGGDSDSAEPQWAEDREEAEPAARAHQAPPFANEAEKENHRLTGHAKFRSWCPHCVATRGRSDGHPRRNPNGDREFPELAWDYGYLASRGDQEEDSPAPAPDADADNAGHSPLLVLRDGRSKGIYPYLVQAKGVDHEAVAREVEHICRDLDRMGYKRVGFKCDNEPSLLAFLRLVRRH